MSYADVAAHNAPPVALQPQPDQGLLTTPADIAHDDVADDAGKVNVVPHDFKENPTTVTSETTDSAHIPPPAPPVTVKGPAPVHPSKKEKAKGRFEKAEGKAKEKFYEAEEEGIYLYHKAKDVVLRPHVAGGLIGVGMWLFILSIDTRVLIHEQSTSVSSLQVVTSSTPSLATGATLAHSVPQPSARSRYSAQKALLQSRTYRHRKVRQTSAVLSLRVRTSTALDANMCCALVCSAVLSVS